MFGVKVPVPVDDQVPVVLPSVMLPVNAASEGLQMDWSGPAFTTAFSSTNIFTLSALLHTPWVIVHFNMTESPIMSPVIPEAGDAGVVIVAVPEITVQFPVPVAGIFPESVAVVTLHNILSVPAIAVVGI